MRSKHGADNVKLIFPAAILVKGTVYKDLFPDWHSVLSHSRVTNVNDRIIKSLNEHTDWKTDSINHPLFANKTACPPSQPLSHQPTVVSSNTNGNNDKLPRQSHTPYDNSGKNTTESDDTILKLLHTPNDNSSGNSPNNSPRGHLHRSRSTSRRTRVPIRNLSPESTSHRSPSIQQIREQFNSSREPSTTRREQLTQQSSVT